MEHHNPMEAPWGHYNSMAAPWGSMEAPREGARRKCHDPMEAPWEQHLCAVTSRKHHRSAYTTSIVQWKHHESSMEPGTTMEPVSNDHESTVNARPMDPPRKYHGSNTTAPQPHGSNAKEKQHTTVTPWQHHEITTIPWKHHQRAPIMDALWGHYCMSPSSFHGSTMYIYGSAYTTLGLIHSAGSNEAKPSPVE